LFIPSGFVGLESINSRSLAEVEKRFNKTNHYGESIKNLQDEGIGIETEHLFLTLPVNIGYRRDAKRRHIRGDVPVAAISTGTITKTGQTSLVKLGQGFPGRTVSFLAADERSARRWRRERLDRVIREDIRDLEGIRNIQRISMFLDTLRGRVGEIGHPFQYSGKSSDFTENRKILARGEEGRPHPYDADNIRITDAMSFFRDFYR